MKEVRAAHVSVVDAASYRRPAISQYLGRGSYARTVELTADVMRSSRTIVTTFRALAGACASADVGMRVAERWWRVAKP